MPKKYYYKSSKLTKTAKKAFCPKKTDGQNTRDLKSTSFRCYSDLSRGDCTKITLFNFETECKNADESIKDIIYQLLKLMSQKNQNNQNDFVNKNIKDQIRNIVWTVNLIYNCCFMTGETTRKEILYIKCTCINSANCPVAIYLDTKANKLYFNKKNHLPLENEIETILTSFKRAQLEGTYRATVKDFEDIFDIIKNAEIKPPKNIHPKDHTTINV